jgi:hypothetical protein
LELYDGGHADPDMAIEERLASRSRSWVMVQAGALNAGAMALDGGVVNGDDETLARDEVLNGAEDPDGLGGGIASTGPNCCVTLAKLR